MKLAFCVLQKSNSEPKFIKFIDAWVRSKLMLIRTHTCTSYIIHVVQNHFNKLFFRVIFHAIPYQTQNGIYVHCTKRNSLTKVVRCHFCSWSQIYRAIKWKWIIFMKYSTVCRMFCQTLHTQCLYCTWRVFLSEFLNSLNVQYPSIMYALFNEVCINIVHIDMYMFNQEHCFVYAATCQRQ